MIRTLGIDLSLNHAAFVQLDDGQLSKYLVITDTKSILKTAPECTMFLDVSGDGDAKSLNRLSWWLANIHPILNSFDPIDYVAIEDYAYSAKQGAHQIGEVGGLLRLALWDLNLSWRKYTPGQIKLYTAHKGRAEKDEMVKAVKDRWNMDFSFLRPGATKLWTSAEDAADAYSAAHLVWTEALLRKGMRELSSLPEAEIRVFMTAGKKEPNVLGKEWLKRVA